MSDFRIEKRQAPAIISLASGARIEGGFYVATASHEGIHELLNGDDQFLPIYGMGDKSSQVRLVNREHVVTVRVSEPGQEPEIDMSLGITPRRLVSLVLSTGESVAGVLRIAMPQGQDRISDFVNSGTRFFYVDGGDALMLVNRDHVVEILPIAVGMAR